MINARWRASVLCALLLLPLCGAREPAVVYRGRLPNGWGKLGLSTEQAEKVRAIQGKARAEREKLEKQIEQIKARALQDATAVLTDVQRQRAVELRIKIAPKEEATPKPPAKPRDDGK
jgi:hypothetical protein